MSEYDVVLYNLSQQKVYFFFRFWMDISNCVGNSFSKKYFSFPSLLYISTKTNGPLLMSSGISILVASLFHPITSKVSSDLGCRVPRLSVIINALPFRVYSLGDPACFQVSASLRLLTRNELHLASDLVYFAYYSSRGLNLSVIFHRHSRIMSAKWIGRRKIGL